MYQPQTQNTKTGLFCSMQPGLHRFVHWENKTISKWYNKGNSSGQVSAVPLHLKEKGNSFADNYVNILAREDRWFKKGDKESTTSNWNHHL